MDPFQLIRDFEEEHNIPENVDVLGFLRTELNMNLQSDINFALYAKIPNFEDHLPVIHRLSAVLIPGQEIDIAISSIQDREAFQIAISNQLNTTDHCLIVPKIRLAAHEEEIFQSEISTENEVSQKFALFYKSETIV